MSRERSSERIGSDVAAVRERFHDVVVTGVALTVPAFVTLLVFGFAVNFVANAVQPVVDFVRSTFGVGTDTPDPYLQALALVGVFATVLLVGFVAEFRSGDRIDRIFDRTMERIPGLGSVYGSFNEMSEMLLSDDAHSFREVYLVEYPTAGSYVVGFVTADTPAFVAEATDSGEMITLFVPMAPNPVMGGFVVHVSADNVYDVDMTVEEGLQSIVTSGVAVGDSSSPVASPDELAAISGPGPVARTGDGDGRPTDRGNGSERSD